MKNLPLSGMRVVMLGAGNVAYHLVAAFEKDGATISEVYSYTPTHARALAKRCHARAITQIQKVNTQADLYVLALRDDALDDVVAAMPFPEHGIVLHTSGSTPISLLKRFTKYGVLYPLQTLSKNKPLDFRTVNLCLEAGNPQSKKQIRLIGQAISDHTHWVNSKQRLALHVSAVFACNFTNHLYALAEILTKENNLSFSLLHALIAETAHKASAQSPQKSQTGPAVRRDHKIIKKHLAFLNEHPDFKKLYQQLSKSIQNNSTPD
jgi:predicted short-subunit dehydrogenase-like oxidoreductase (DUF2520 family)